MLHFGKTDWQTFERGIEREWLVTNGIGGYASGTLINANTRKYHGLLVAAHNPPGWRIVQLVKMDERFTAGQSVYNLAANETASGFNESGFIHLQQVRFDPFPTFIYSFRDIIMERTVFMVYGQNTTVVRYRIFNGDEPGLLRITPLVNCRGYHFITNQGQFQFEQKDIPGGVSISGRDDIDPLRLTCDAGSYVQGGYWYHGMAYAAEKERGENPYEDHYVPGHFVVPLESGETRTFSVIGSTVEADHGRVQEWLDRQRDRIKGIVAGAGYEDPFARELVQAADAFIVLRRSTGKKTVIAGYPWFTDWGRDTMIALPGLTLVTKRFDEAREILLTYARQCHKGLLPNSFKIGAKDPIYNTVDASLWFANAVYKYLTYTGDHEFIGAEIYPVLKDIIHWYKNGTEFDIAMDDDGLLMAGSPDVQLTWMDAKVDNWVVTPRHGKAVEINALWYNAVMVLNKMCGLLGEEFPYPGLPDRIRQSFLKAFWDERAGYLCDVVNKEGRDFSIRPNQLMAVSLPFGMLTPEQGRRMVQRVWKDLYVTYGIRSLSPGHSEYRGRYLGDRIRRDSSYHQGTAWSWLMGQFITAYRKAHEYSPDSLIMAQRFISPFRDQLRSHGVGYISEIFDGEEPVVPRGCIAQAWGVAEILRAYVEDVLEIGPPGRLP